MPKLDWIGKDAVARHHLDVPYRLLHCNGKMSAGDVDAGNLLVQGDNLETLKSILPYYAGKVNCIYIDPPYNTGNEGWKYNDKVNSPQIRRWLNKVVGGEDADLCRHDKWLCMMYPRLRLLREFLREDGVIFVSIDDNEQHRLRMLMDEIFGKKNFYAMINWTARNKPMNAGSALYKFQKSEEYILAYGKIPMRKHPPFNIVKNKEKTYPLKDRNGLEYREEEVQQRKNIGIKKSDVMVYSICGISPHEGYRWTIGRKNANNLVKEKRIFVKKGKICQIIYKQEESNFVFDPIWANWSESCGTSESGKNLLDAIAPNHGLETVKPINLLKKLIFHFTDNDGIVLDSFAGSGTTAHAVLQQNKLDGGNRRFILVEMEEKIATDITAKRIQKIIKGYSSGDKKTAPLGGGFRYCILGKPLFNEFGGIAPDVKFADLAAHIFFSETGSPIPLKPKNALLGAFEGRAIYLLYNGIMGDKSRDGGNILTLKTLRELPPHPDGKKFPRIVYGEGSILSKESLKRENILFKQIPYQIKTE